MKSVVSSFYRHLELELHVPGTPILKFKKILYGTALTNNTRIMVPGSSSIYYFVRETFGERGLSDKMLTHYAETDNELHHLLIMESLGGNEHVFDRILAQTMVS